MEPSKPIDWPVSAYRSSLLVQSYIYFSKKSSQELNTWCFLASDSSPENGTLEGQAKNLCSQ